VHQAEQARHLGDAGGARDQPQRDLRQAELDPGIVHRHPVMRDQRHFPAATQGRAIEAAHHRFAQCLERAEILLGQLDFAEHARRVRGLQSHRALEIGTGEECALGRRQDDALDGFLVLHHPRRHLGQVLLPLLAHRVDRRAGLVEGDRGDAVLEFVLDGFHINVRPALARDVLPFMFFRRSSRCPCRRPRTASPFRSGDSAGAARRSACSGSSRRWRPAGGPSRWRRR
jgi:hypothetical protein